MLNRITVKALLGLVVLITLGLLTPEHCIIPVEGATSSDWNPKSFWYEPWGVSGVHKGIDIFAQQGKKVVSATPGLVIYRGEWSAGGTVVVVLGPKWRIHYYAHLAEHAADTSLFVAQGAALGSVGTTGNAAGKAPHLHYAIFSLVPIPWRYSAETQGWRKIFYLDPSALIKPVQSGAQ